LSKINPKCEITPIPGDFFSCQGLIDLKDFDLIINLSASNPIDLYFERLSKEEKFPILATGMTNNDSSVLIATISGQEYVGGPKQLLRDFHVRMFSSPDLLSITKTIWPEANDEKLFQPEPGCSEPTFVGSGADMQFLASYFVNQVSKYLTSSAPKSGFLFGMDSSNNDILRSWNYKPITYEQFDSKDKMIKVRISGKALAQLKSHISEAIKARGPSCETGGMIYGHVENSIDLVIVDECTDAPSDSKFSASGFVCGTTGVEELSDKIAAATDKESCFVGYWHTHPNGPTNPSFTDLLAAFSTVSTSGENLRQVLFMIINPDNFTFDFYFFNHVNGEMRIILVHE
jgi:proteasome lid subunit RPN8/RPN11